MTNFFREKYRAEIFKFVKFHSYCFMKPYIFNLKSRNYNKLNSIFLVFLYQCGKIYTKPVGKPYKFFNKITVSSTTNNIKYIYIYFCSVSLKRIRYILKFELKNVWCTPDSYPNLILEVEPSFSNACRWILLFFKKVLIIFISYWVH